jgi:hypothetical protein
MKTDLHPFRKEPKRSNQLCRLGSSDLALYLAGAERTPQRGDPEAYPTAPWIQIRRIGVLREEKHLPVPSVKIQRPAVRNATKGPSPQSL